METVMSTAVSALGRAATFAAPRHLTVTAPAEVEAGGDCSITGFVPIEDVSWPRAVTELLDRTEAFCSMRYLPGMRRSCITSDNRLVLWDPVTGRDLCVFNTNLSTQIIAVSEAVVPRAGIFRAIISQVLAVASTDMVALLGVEQRLGADGAVMETQIVDVGFYAPAPCLILKFTVDAESGSIFAAGSDGKVYNIAYSISKLLLQPRMRLEGSQGLVSRWVSGAIGRLTGRVSGGLVDVCFQNAGGIVCTLDVKGTVRAFRADKNGALSEVCAYHHGQADSGQLLTAAPQSSARIHSIHPGDQRDTLVAVLESGERLFLGIIEGWGLSSSSTLEVQARAPSPLQHRHAITQAWYTQGIFVSSHADTMTGATGSDFMTLVSDGRGGEPSTATPVEAPPNTCLRVEAVSEVSYPSSVPEEVLQAVSQPRQIAVTHRGGVSFFMRLRPVDRLQVALEAPRERRDRLVAAVSGNKPPAELCSMLLQLAARATHTRLSSARASSGSSRLRTPSCGQLDPAIRTVVAGPSHAVARTAAEMLRLQATPALSDAPRGAVREVSVGLSQFALGANLYIGRLLSPIWSLPVAEGFTDGSKTITLELLATTEQALGRAAALLERLRGDVWQEGAVCGGSSSVTVHWQRERALVEIPHTAVFTQNDARAVQGQYCRALMDATHGAMQLTLFLQYCRRFSSEALPPQSVLEWAGLDPKVSFGHLVSHREDACKLAQGLARRVSQIHGSVRHEAGHLLSSLERDCPFLFSGADREQCEAVLDFTALIGRSNVPQATLQQTLARVSAVAGALYRSGPLRDLIAQLREVGMAREAVALCLHAAAQTAPSAAEDWFALMQLVKAILQQAFERDRSTFDRLVGTPHVGGSLWFEQPNDARTHVHLLEWLSQARADDAVTETLRGTLVHVPSPHLEQFLSSNVHDLGLTYAEYLAKRKGDPAAALAVCARLMEDRLEHLAPSERLPLRLKCARMILEGGVRGPQRSNAEVVVQGLLLQIRLATAIRACLSSGARALDEYVPGENATQRELAERHLRVVEGEVLSQDATLALSRSYELFGGLDILLDALAGGKSTDAAATMRVVRQVLSSDPARTEEVLRMLLERLAVRNPRFPLASCIAFAESLQHRLEPSGSPAVPMAVLAAGLPLDRVVDEYLTIVQRRGADGTGGAPPDGFLLHSLAVLLVRSREGRQSRRLEALLPIVRDALHRVVHTAAGAERTAVERASALLAQIGAA